MSTKPSVDTTVTGIAGLAFVATGPLEHFGCFYDEYTDAYDLSDLKVFIEDRGGFLAEDVTPKTDYVICDFASMFDEPCRRAEELGIPIVTEEQFLAMARTPAKGCESQEFYIKDNVLLQYTGKQEHVVIPDSITAIGCCAFYACDQITSVTIPNSVTEIGGSAFCDCTALTTLTIPEGVTHIGGYAFDGCAALTAVTIPDGVTEIGNSAFYGCLELTQIDIPAGVTKIGECAFGWCRALTSVTIPNSVTAIGEAAFEWCRALTSVTIPGSVTTIDGRAFEQCDALTTVSIAEGVNKIGDGTFYGCTSLTSLILPASVQSIGRSALYDCPRLSHVIAASQAVLDMALEQMQRETRSQLVIAAAEARTTDPYMIRKIKLCRKTVMAHAIRKDHDGVASFLLEQFASLPLATLDAYLEQAQNAPKVTAVLLAYKHARYSSEYQEKQEEIQMEKAFGLREKTLADWKKEYSLVKEADGYVIRGYKGLDTVVVVPQTMCGLPVVGIGAGAFSPVAARVSADLRAIRSAITAITLPDGVVKIGDSAFKGCSALTSIHIPENITEIGDSAFCDCQALTSITIPKGITQIGESVFSGCNALAAITLPDGVVKIGDSAFERCSALTAITIPSRVTRIGNNAFKCCSALTKVIIPNSVTQIGYSAFYACHALTSVTIPIYVTEIGLWAFYYTPVTIYAPAGSAAQRYAKQNNIRFVAI